MQRLFPAGNILFPFRPLGKTVELLIHREYNTCEVLLKEYTRTVENYIWACDFGRKTLFQGVSVLKPKE
jgi:hypothetical protein